MKYFFTVFSIIILISCTERNFDTKPTILSDTSTIELFEPISINSIEDTVEHISHNSVTRTSFLNKLTKILELRSLNTLYNSLDNFKTDSLSYQYMISKNRTIVSTYKEVQLNLNVEEIIFQKPIHYFSYPYELRIISKNDQIITCQIFENNINKESVNNYSLVETKMINDTMELKKLDEIFKLSYHSTLNKNNLFVSDIVYGFHCGITGAKTDFQQKLEKLVEVKDTLALTNWLKSGNTELQLYAVNGFHQLAQSTDTFKIHPETLKMINLVKEKEGNVSTCSGCTHMNLPIKDIITRIEK